MSGSFLLRKRACITGGGRGLGLAIAHQLAKRGAKLLLVGRDLETLESASAAIEAQHDVEVDVHAADLATDAGLDSTVDLMSKIGGIDVLVNCAGVFPVGPLNELTREAYDHCFALNVRAPMFLSQAMVGQSLGHGHGRGKILHIASSSSFAGFANTAAYCASKHALLGLARALHSELQPLGIRSISVSPGSLKTEMGQQVVGQRYETFLEPIDVARVVGELLDDSSNMSIAELRIDRYDR